MPRPIRILFPFVGGKEIGGSHISAMLLIRNLDPARYDPVILVHRPNGPFVDALNEAGLRYESLPGVPLLRSGRTIVMDGTVGFAGYLLRTVPALRTVISRLKPDIVHTNDGRMHVNWALPTRLSAASSLWHHRQSPAAWGINRMAPILADRIASVSHYAKPDKPIRSVDSKFSVVYSPFDFRSSRPDRPSAREALRRELDISEPALILGYFGMLIGRKRPDHFVRAIAAIQEGMPDVAVHGLIFGAAACRGIQFDEVLPELSKELGLGSRIRLMGHRAPIEPYLAGVDATLVPALFEPFGRTLIEAMHLGTPVVAVDHGGNSEAIVDGEDGFLVDPHDPAAFVEPIRKLYEDEALRSRIVAKAQGDVAMKYSLERHVSGVTAIYEDMMAGQSKDTVP